MADETDTLAENAAAPKKVKSDGLEVEQHSLSEQIEAERFQAAKKAVKSKGLGLRLNKISPPGSA